MAERVEPAAPVVALRHVEHVMGMAVSIHVRDHADISLLEPALALLHDVDARFSTYRPDSDVTRLARGSIALEDCGADLRAVLALADALRLRTGGYFDMLRPGIDGEVALDPSGVVKGWAVDSASELLSRAGLRSFYINAGGDVVVRSADGAPPWRIGIRHPFDAGRVYAVVEAANLCVATSGTYERGAHIIDPHTGQPPSGLASLTVVGSSLAMVDAFATAAFAMGIPGVAWVARQPGYGVCGVTTDMRVRYDDEFARRRVV